MTKASLQVVETRPSEPPAETPPVAAATSPCRRDRATARLYARRRAPSGAAAFFTIFGTPRSLSGGTNEPSRICGRLELSCVVRLLERQLK
jgi:hypothetical protein